VADPPTANVIGEKWAEPVPPEPHGIVADVDPALSQQFFDVPQAQWNRTDFITASLMISDDELN